MVETANRISLSSLFFMGILFMLISSCKKDENKNITITDIDGNVYHSVIIGTQVWMVENLNTSRYRDGDSIPCITDDSIWFHLTTGAYRNYILPSNGLTYGRLYNWYAVADSRNICPTGWHVPSEASWVILADYLGGESIAGGKLKETGLSHWQTPNGGATNETGFTALPGGDYGSQGDEEIGTIGNWWASDESEVFYSYCRSIYYYDSRLMRGSASKIFGFSIRCLKD